MRARLADVAAHAGVSEATVSRVLNGNPMVSSTTRKTVVTALDVLGYERPARLRPRRAGLVGLVVPELENPIFPAFAQAIESVLAQHSYTPVLCTQSPGGGVTEEEYVEMLLDRGVSGIIFVSGLNADTTSDHASYVAMVERRLPVVFINGFVDEVDAPFISSDDVCAAELAVGHLVSMGHRRIAFASGPKRYQTVLRKREGYRAVMRRLVGTDDEQLDALTALSLFSVEGGQAAAGRLLAQEPTAFVCGSDLMALGAIRAVRRAGLKVPEDISVVGYDDSPLVAFTDPPLTTMRQPVQAMALAAVSALTDEINGHASPHAEYLFQPELVVRGSSGPAPHAR